MSRHKSGSVIEDGMPTEPTESYRALQSLDGWKWSNRVIDCSCSTSLVHVGADQCRTLSGLGQVD